MIFHNLAVVLKVVLFPLCQRFDKGKSHSANNIIAVFDIVIGGEHLISSRKGKRRGLKRDMYIEAIYASTSVRC